MAQLLLIAMQGPVSVRPENYQSFVLFLQDELVHRCKKNPGYSLRSFARALQINHSSLSRLLSGQRKVSERMQRSLIARLGHDPEVIRHFKQESTTNKRALEKARDFNQMNRDAFAVISDWYHYAILELTLVSTFRSEPRWIAKSLGITVSEANAAIDRLIRLGMLQRNANGQLKNASGNNTNIEGEIRDAAKRKMQKQILEHALKALEEVSVDQRNQTSMTMAISTKRLPEAIEMISKFRRKISAFLEQDPDRDEVYQLSISLFPTTKLNGDKK
jgi:uncharacterized protein (TIGR02147 family)